MTEDDDAPGRSGGHVPLPPEQPAAPAPELTGAADDAGDIDPGAPRGAVGEDGEGAGISAAPGRVDVPPAGDVDIEDAAAPGGEWWRGGDVRDELRDDWHSHTTEAGVAAQELGYQLQQAAGTISDAVASTAYPAATKRGLDLRWMRMSVNGPAIALALLVTYGGRTSTDRMVQVLIEDGPFAPLGWVLLAVLLFGIVMVLPIGTPLAHAIGHLVQWAASGLVAAVRRGWQTPVIGYLLRLALAVFVWSFVFAVVWVAGRSIIHWLTGA